MYFVYILKCADGTLYTGSTNDVEKRLAVHSSRLGAKYTRARLPVKLVYVEKLKSKSKALKREWEIKHWPRGKKIKELYLKL